MAKWLIVPYISVVWWCCYHITPASCLANETDRLALISFKASINQDPFGALISWDESVHYCQWNGILCSRRHPDRVIELNLRSQLLAGSLSPHVGNLSFLKTIDLGNNSFRGPIPQEIGRLFRLRKIEFSNNSFNGEIPINVSRCLNLKYLNLINNNLTGNIPAELGSLAKLGVLLLGTNKLSGTIPHSIGNLSSLYKLSLLDCNLHGKIPEKIGRLRGLMFVELSGNNLSGKIPSGIFNISAIYVLRLAVNQLHGSIPSDMGLTLPNLKILKLFNNSFTGRVPTSLSNASSLETISLSGNFLTGPMPKDLGKLEGLKSISFSTNQIEDDLSFISSLTNCTSLKVLDVGTLLLRGSLPDSLTNLSISLKALDVRDNQLYGSIPSGIGNLVNLAFLHMGLNHLSGPIPTTIGKLHYLQKVYLGENNFTMLPSSLGNLTSLNLLYLDRNNIHGTIPSSLGNCCNLLVLDISYNNLKGSIPPRIMTLSSVSILFSLAHNVLTGALPQEVGSLKNLAELDVSHNRLSGHVPNSLSNCLSLERLHLEANSFEGGISQSLRDLRGLRELDLSRNNLTGLIPSYLGNLDLERLNLSFNQLHGEVPIEGVFQNGSAISVVGNNDLCGGIPELNFPPCPSSKSNKKNLSRKIKVILPIIVILMFCLTSLVWFFIVLSRRHVSRKMASSIVPFKHQLLRVSYAELLKATDGFSEDNLIGVGRYGSVYKGILDEILVAVKVLHLHIKGASKSFVSECKALRTVRHRNLLKILNACSSIDFHGNEFKALVCEFMAKGSLEKWLHHDGIENEGEVEESRNLKLFQRLNIAIDVASALEYLHCHCDSTIVHGDLKPSNVLLDDEMTAHVGDFGLAKIISVVPSEVEQHQSNSTAVRGTIGYVAPEYGLGNRASTMGDVYSYGILLLEMFTGKIPIDDQFKDGMSLHHFVMSALPNEVMEIVDPCIFLEHKPQRWIMDILVSVLRIGVACSMESQSDRMQIGDVVSELCKIKNVYENHGSIQDYKTWRPQERQANRSSL